MNNNNLLDIWRFMHHDQSKYTWQRLRPSPVFVRFDFFLLSEIIYQPTTEAEIVSGFQTDHSIPVVRIDFSEHSRGSGFWKFNVSLLKDETFTEQLGKAIDVELAQTCTNMSTKWEMIKFTIRNVTLKYSTRKTKALNLELAALERKLQNEEESLPSIGPGLFVDKEEQILRIKQDINKILEKKTAGATIRCRANWIEMGEKPTGYFLSKEKQLHNSRTLEALNNQYGVKLTHQAQILKEEYNFFRILYQTKREEITQPYPNDTIREYFNDFKIPKLTEDESLMLEEPIVFEEVVEAIKVMPNNKAPGSDGICIEVYKCYLFKLAPILVSTYMEIMNNKIMHLSTRRGMITLMEKIGRDPLYLPN